MSTRFFAREVIALDARWWWRNPLEEWALAA
jgi:hypothetical protein